MILSSLTRRVTRGQVKNGKGGRLKGAPLFRNQVSAFLCELLPEKHDVRRFPTERAVKQFGIAPYIGDQNLLALLTERFFNGLNQSGSNVPKQNSHRKE